MEKRANFMKYGVYHPLKNKRPFHTINYNIVGPCRLSNGVSMRPVNITSYCKEARTYQVSQIAFCDKKVEKVWIDGNASNDFDEENNVSTSDKTPGDKERHRVLKIQSLFHELYKVLPGEGGCKRIDHEAAATIKDSRYYVDIGKCMGSIPGVDVGDEFQYRMEIAILGLHKPTEAGIDFIKHENGRDDICISIVAVGSGEYENNMRSEEAFIFSGQGGIIGRARKEPEDQTLVGGNLAMKNSIYAKNPIRVIRGNKESGVKGNVERIYIYDGLYRVEAFWGEKAAHGKLVFKFKLVRIPGQPKLPISKRLKLGAC